MPADRESRFLLSGSLHCQLNGRPVDVQGTKDRLVIRLFSHETAHDLVGLAAERRRLREKIWFINRALRWSGIVVDVQCLDRSIFRLGDPNAGRFWRLLGLPPIYISVPLLARFLLKRVSNLLRQLGRRNGPLSSQR